MSETMDDMMARLVKEGETHRARLIPQDPPSAMSRHDLLEAAKAATADRGLNYGRPEDNFRRIARLWNAHLVNRHAEGFGGDTGMAIPTLDAIDVAQMMALLKIARLEHAPDHMDSVVDLAGYAACLAEIVSQREVG